MFARRKFQHSLNLVLVLFTTAICLLYSAALLWGVQTAEDHIVNNHLRGEFRRFKQRYRALPVDEKQTLDKDFNKWLATSKPLVSQGFLVYSADSPDLPHFARGLPDGIWDIPNTDFHFLADYLGPHRTILLFDEHQIFREDRIEHTLKVLLILFSLILIFLSFGISLMISKKIASPIVRLSDQLKGDRPYPPFIEEKRQDEIGELARSFSEMVQRLNGFLEREKQFTRHASHELRTPIAIMANSSSVLGLPTIDPEKKKRNLDRIGNAIKDMNALIETFLVLGREENLDRKWVDVNLAVLSSLKKIATPEASPVLEFPEKQQVRVDPALFDILLDNLLKNAMTYSQGRFSIALKEQKLVITNDISEHVDPNGSFGFGLEIINRIVDRLGWRFETQQEKTLWRSIIYFPPENETKRPF